MKSINKLRNALNKQLEIASKIQTNNGIIYSITKLSLSDLVELINSNSEFYEASLYREFNRPVKLCINLIDEYSEKAKEEEAMIKDLIFYSNVSNFEIENYI